MSVSARGDRVAVLVDTDGCDGLGVRSGERAQELALGEPACVEGVSQPAAISVTEDGGWVSDGGSTKPAAATWSRGQPAADEAPLHPVP